MADRKLSLTLILIAVVVVAFIILIGSSVRLVGTGSVEVVTNFGRVTGRTLYPGANFIVPFVESTIEYNTRILLYETTTQDKQLQSMADFKDFPVDTNTKDGQRVDIYYTVRFSVDSKRVNEVAQNIGTLQDIFEKIVKADSRIWARNVPREFEAELLYTGNVQEVQIRIEEKLIPIFEKKGIILDEFGIREIKFADEYVKAIEAKQIEAVKIQAERNIAEQAKFKKEAQITSAEAQAREQELLRQSITPALVQKLWIEKWDGKLPTVMGSGANLLDISSFVQK
jgi:regulator of protease activity HflC (stomatin/prohibitin superfamily)